MTIVLLIAAALHLAIMAILASAWWSRELRIENVESGAEVIENLEGIAVGNGELKIENVESGEWRVESEAGVVENEATPDPQLSTLHSQLSTPSTQLSTPSTQLSTPSTQLSIPSTQLSILNSQFSILIAAHNEAQNLANFLPMALEQRYDGDYEVIVALDRCTDGSAQVVADLQARYAHLRVLHIDAVPAGWTGKKHALNLAIAAAQHDCLALTDADCALPPTWLAGMAAEFASGKDLVLGVSPYAPAPGLLNLLIRFETWITALLYIGLARLGLPYMGVGRSMAYRKAWFQQAGGFDDIAHRLSGDDDLLVNRAARAGKVGWSVAVENQVISLPKRSWGAWLSQKIRHGSAGTAYKPGSLLILSLIHGLHLIFYLSLIVVLCLQSTADPTTIGSALVIYLVRSVAMIALLASIPWRHKTALVLAFPLLDVLYLGYVLLLPATAFIQPKWKK
jgi:cellulose synthase/poly-beta-1,6-N-acetylglucosamine synthase-like glycosyltransferase